MRCSQSSSHTGSGSSDRRAALCNVREMLRCNAQRIVGWGLVWAAALALIVWGANANRQLDKRRRNVAEAWAAADAQLNAMNSDCTTIETSGLCTINGAFTYSWNTQQYTSPWMAPNERFWQVPQEDAQALKAALRGNESVQAYVDKTDYTHAVLYTAVDTSPGRGDALFIAGVILVFLPCIWELGVKQALLCTWLILTQCCPTLR